MEEIWKKVCAHYDVPEQVANEWFTRIQQHLSTDSPARAYHNWDQMMQRKESHLAECNNPNIVLAAFFQYYHFDGNRSCVEQNCEVFQEFCKAATIEDNDTKSLVCTLLGRKTPENEVYWCHDDEANLLQDVDLVVLASSPEEYKHYTTLLRSEYANLNDATYKAMRIKVLETLLLIPSIYATGEYHDKYEEQARANIRSEILELKKALGARPGRTAPTQQATEVASGSSAMPPVANLRGRSAFPAADQPAGFRKFKDVRAKNSPKRLQQNAQKKKKMDRKYIHKLLSSIKKKYKINKSPHFKRRLEFRKDPLVVKKVLPKPKFYRPPKANGNHQNDTIEDGEIIEELQSSDDDDCVLQETPTPCINIDEDESDVKPSTSEKKFMACQRRAELLTSPHQILFKDCRRETALLRASTPQQKLLYSTIAKKASPNVSCIVLDDSFVTPKPKKSLTTSDSVIVIDDDPTEDDFIPLPPDEPTENISKKNKKKTKRRNNKMNDSLFTTAEKKELGKYNSNTFNPTDDSEDTDNEPKSNKRAVIIDGSNVAFAHGNSNIFSSEGIKYCLQYFDKMGHNVKAVIPMFRKNATKSSNPELLDKLHKEGKIVFTPCKNLPGQMSTSYDDRFILQLAYEWNAAVVSNDNYRDLINENPAFKKIVETRVLGYSWCDNIFILPKDPYGRWGPTLDEILKC